MLDLLTNRFLKLSFIILLFNGITIEAYGQEHTVQGTVTSTQGETLPGVNVVVQDQETTIGTSTNVDGEYRITVPSPNEVLVFSFVGFQTQIIPIEGRDVVDVVLEPQIFSGDDVIVIGYGTTTRGDVTGSIGSVPTEAFQDRAVTNVTEVLRGRVSGVDVVSTGNRPGAESTILIRGQRSILADNDPLFVIDGVPFEGTNLNDINPADIESMEVLKDASAAAIYGSRGANGVVLITTKKGVAGQTRISYRGRTGFSKVQNFADIMSGERFAELKRESRRGAGRPIPPDEELFEAAELQSLQSGQFADWQRLVTQTGAFNDHTFQVQGGSEQLTFLFSGNFLRDEGVVLEESFERFNGRANIDYRVNDRFRVAVNTVWSRSELLDNGGQVMDLAIRLNPLGQPFNEDGSLRFSPTSDGLVSNALTQVQSLDRQALSNRIFASIVAEYETPIKGLTYQLNFGPDLTTRREGQFLGSLSNENRGSSPDADQTRTETFNFTLENLLNYELEIGSKHEFNVTGLYSFQQFEEEELLVNVSDLPFEFQEFFDLASAQTINGFGSGLTEWALQSGMLRLNYSYDNKYLFTFTGRTDGSSRFAEGQKYGFFPTIAGSWRITQEDYFNVESVSELKFRGSWGRTGNTAIDPFQTGGQLETTGFNFGTDTAFGSRPNILANPNLVWEKTAEFNFGLDFGLLENRISGSFDWYRATTQDLLLPRALPAFQGFTSIIDNIGTTRNKGVEIALRTTNIQTTDIDWSTSFTYANNNNSIISLFGTGDDVGNEWFIGEPVEVIFELEKEGIWQLDEEAEAASFGQVPGEIKVVDQNGDGQINADDRIIHGSPFPNWTASFSSNLFYKSFDLAVLVETRQGITVRDQFQQAGFNSLQGRFNNIDVDFWTPENPTNAFPQPNIDTEFPVFNETLDIIDGDFWRIRNVTFGYTLPPSALSIFGGDTLFGSGIRNMRIYFSAENPFILHGADFKGFDIETGRQTSANNPLLPGGQPLIPSRRSFVFGIDVDF